jgi:hypothetical protein
MQRAESSTPEVVVEELQAGNNLLRLALIALGAVAFFVCACIALFLAYSQYTQNQALTLADITATRTRVFAATWTPTTTDTPEATGTPRPTATTTRTPTTTPTETDTPIPPTDTNTPRPPTNTPRPRPTNTPRPRPTNTPVPPPAPTNTTAPSYQYSITSQRSYQNEGSLGIFGTVRDRSGNLIGGASVLVITSGGAGLVASTTGNFLNNSSDRNFEISSDPRYGSLGPGTYTVYVATKVGSDYSQISPSVSVTIRPVGGGATQWWGIDFRQN